MSQEVFDEQDELFDLVNENDKVIGTTNKEQSHKKGQWHRIVAIYVLNPDDPNQFYVQERDGEGTFDHSVGGHIRQGEIYNVAAEREGREELGLSDTSQPISIFLSDERFSGINVRHVVGLFKCVPSRTWSFNPTEEVKVVQLKTFEDVVEEMNDSPELFTGGFINTMQEYLRQNDLPHVIYKHPYIAGKKK